MEKKLVSFENSYRQGHDELKHDEDMQGAWACDTIDGFPENEDEDGEVVCVVYITNNAQFIVDWHNNAYRMNETVRELIKESTPKPYIH